MRVARFLLLAVLAAGGPGFPAVAARPADAEILRAAPLGPIVEAPDGRSEMELVRFDERVATRLQALAPEETLRVDDWPVSPGQRARVVLRRFDVYAPDAKIVVIEDGVEREIPRSVNLYFMGRFDEDPSGRFLTSLDPVRGTLRSFMTRADENYELREIPDAAGVYGLGRRDAFIDPGASELPPWRCGQDELLPSFGRRTLHEPSTSGTPAVALAPRPTTLAMVVAVDTDNEFLNLKFSNNAASATSYIANLFAQMNLIYERDVGLKLLQGYTILRPSTTTDPWAQAPSPCGPGFVCANGAQLTEFSEYWRVHYQSVRRAIAMMLSGKTAAGASGIAWLDALCEKGIVFSGGTYGGYSFNQVYLGTNTEVADTGITAHEIGHNFSSPHTHCYADPKPDTCWVEVQTPPNPDCFGGSVACPSTAVYNGVSAKGTLMSYCHLLSGCSAGKVFHPESLTRYLDPAISVADNAGGCVFAIGVPAPTVTSVSPASGILAGGTVLTITGTNFVNGATVAFVELPSNNVFGTPSSKIAASITFNSATQLTVTTPSASSVGAVDVVVMNPDQQTATLRSGYSYSACDGFFLSSVSPRTGTAGGNTLVTLGGCGFLAGATVSVGGAAATSVTLVDGSTLTARTPARPIGPADVVVTNPGGATASIPGGFLYTASGSPTRLNTITPCRLVDTRNASGPFGGPALAASTTRSFTVSSGSCSVPADAAAVSLNVTVADATVAGSLRLFPGSGTPPATNTITFVPSKNRANNVNVGLVGGVLSVRNDQLSGTVNLVVDVNGYYR